MDNDRAALLAKGATIGHLRCFAGGDDLLADHEALRGIHVLGTDLHHVDARRHR